MSIRTAQAPAAQECLQILTGVQKAISFLRLYPRTHPYCGQAVQSCLEDLRRLLGWRGGLTVAVRRDGVYLDDELVLAEGPQEHGLADLLYPEGIRALGFEPGIEQRELFELLEALAGPADPLAPRPGLLEELWRRDLSHVRCLLHDELSPAAVSSSRHDPALAGVAHRIQELRARHAPPPAAGEVPDPPGAAPLADGEGWAALRAELDDPFAADALGRAADIATWAVTDQAHPGGPTVEDVARFLGQAAVAALWERDVERALELLARAEASCDELLARVRELLREPAQMSLLVRALHARLQEGGEEAAAALGTRYLERLGPGAQAAACRAYGGARDPATRRVLRPFLAAHAAQEPGPVAGLSEHRNEAIAAEAVELLADAGLDTPAWKELCRIAAEGGGARQALAHDLVDIRSGERERRELLATVEAGLDPQARMAALTRLAEVGNARVFERLVAIAESSGFRERDPREIQAVLELLTRLGGTRAVRLLQDLAGQKALVFHRGSTRRLAEAARERLELLRQELRRSR